MAVPIAAISDLDSITRIRAQWSYRFGSGESSWMFLTPRSFGDVRASVMAAWEAACLSHFIAARHTSWRLDQVVAEDYWPGTQPALIDDLRMGADPPGVGHGLPPQCSPVISWRTGEIGRAHRGRTYIGPYCVDSVEESNVVGPGDSAVSAFAEAMMAAFTGVTVGEAPLFVIVSRILDPPLVPNGTYSPVVTYFYPGRWGVVRRRLDWEWRT